MLRATLPNIGYSLSQKKEASLCTLPCNTGLSFGRHLWVGYECSKESGSTLCGTEVMKSSSSTWKWRSDIQSSEPYETMSVYLRWFESWGLKMRTPNTSKWSRAIRAAVFVPQLPLQCWDWAIITKCNQLQYSEFACAWNNCILSIMEGTGITTKYLPVTWVVFLLL